MASKHAAEEEIQLKGVKSIEREPLVKPQPSTSSSGASPDEDTLINAAVPDTAENEESNVIEGAQDQPGERRRQSSVSSQGSQFSEDQNLLPPKPFKCLDRIETRWNKLNDTERILIKGFLILLAASFVLNLFVGFFCLSKEQKFNPVKTTYYSNGTNITESIGKAKKTYSICESDQCKFAAASMNFDLDIMVNPCEDFYGYACGRFVNVQNYRPDIKQTSRVLEMSDEIATNIYSLLVRKPNRIFSDSFNEALKTFTKCVDFKFEVLEDTETLVDIIKELTGFNWPIITKNWTYTEPKSRNLDVFLPIIAKLIKANVPALIDIGVDPNEKNNTKNVIKIKTQLLSLFVSDTSAISASSNGKVPLDARKQEGFVNYVTLLCATLLKGVFQVTDDFVEQAHDMLDFEWTTAIHAKENQSPPRKYGAVMTIDQLEKEIGPTASGHMLKMIKLIAPDSVPITRQTPVEITGRAVNYLDEIFSMVKYRDPRTLVNYFVLLVVREYGQHIDDFFRQSLDAHRLRKRKSYILDILKNTRAIPKLSRSSKSCVDTVHEMYKYAITAEYVTTFNKAGAKKEVNEIFNAIKESYAEQLDYHVWMDDQTREKAKNKINNVIGFISHPDWILSNVKVDAYYKELLDALDNKQPFAYDVLAYNRFRVTKDFQQLYAHGNRSRWDKIRFESPLTPAAAYHPRLNVLVINVGLLSSPFYGKGSQKYISFGSIGFIIAHELAHALGRNAFKYDEHGNLGNWWTEKSLIEFMDKMECFEEQYRQIHVDRIDAHLHAKRTIGEDVADNGGLRQSYLAYRKWVEENGDEARLPFGLDVFTPDQAFFIFVAQSWCSRDPDMALKYKIRYSIHSPDHYRVNVPMSNFKEFSRAFECKNNSRMNPGKKCVLW